MDDTALNAFSARLAPLDWVVIGAYAAGTLAIGWWYSRRNKNADDYLVAGRQMNPVAVGLSFFVALFSTLTYLAVPGEIVRHGPIILAGLLAYPFVLYITGWFIIPAFMRLNVTSGYELLEARLGLAPRLLGVVLFLLMRLMWMGLIVYATVDKVLVPLIGLPAAATPVLCILLAGFTIIYTAMGGLKAIVAVDVIQGCLLFGGVILSLSLITYKLGGVGHWWPDAWAAHWQPAYLVHGPEGARTVLGAFTATLAWYICTAGSDQMAVQRYLATRDVSAARKMLGVSLVAGCTIWLVLGCLGLALLAYATHHPGWAPTGEITGAGADKLFPSFIATVLPSGLAGLIIAGLLAEAMNSLSSGMNASSGVIATDLISRFRRVAWSAVEELRWLRGISVGVGLAVVALSVGVSFVQGNLLELSYKVVNLLTAPLFSLFFFAIFIRWATTFGALVGTGAGLLVTILVNYWREIITGLNQLLDLQLNAAPLISFLWGTPLSLLVAAVVGMLASLLPFGPTAETRSSRRTPATAAAISG